ncbi:MAG: ABC transporter ATP-binding protein [Sulfuricellaceae bacterium]
MNPNALDFKHLAKHYAKNVVLQDIDLDVATGEFFGLVGMNGAGKTTLIKCLLDFCEINGGGIEIFGVAHRLTAARRQLAFLPERFMPPYYLTGGDFLRYMLKLNQLAYDREEVEEMIGKLDLDLSALTRPVHTYSKGMTQKLGLAACFLGKKSLYILDEPMSGLDPKARALLKSHLRDTHATGRTLFFSSHSLSDVEEICDRMAILHNGRLNFIGTPTQCCQIYQAGNLEQAYLRCIGHVF